MSTWLVAMSWVQIPDNLLHDIVLICFVNLLSSRWSHIDTNLFSFRFSSSCFLCFVLVVFCGKTRAGQLSLVPGPLAVWKVSILYGNGIFVYTCGKCCMRPGNKPKVNSGGKFTIMITSSLVPRPLLHLGSKKNHTSSVTLSVVQPYHQVWEGLFLSCKVLFLSLHLLQESLHTILQGPNLDKMIHQRSNSSAYNL